MSTFMDSSATVVEGDNFSAVLDKVLGLMLCAIDSPSAVSEMESIASQCAPIFSLKSSRYLYAIHLFILSNDKSFLFYL